MVMTHSSQTRPSCVSWMRNSGKRLSAPAPWKRISQRTSPEVGAGPNTRSEGTR